MNIISQPGLLSAGKLKGRKMKTISNKHYEEARMSFAYIEKGETLRACIRALLACANCKEITYVNSYLTLTMKDGNWKLTCEPNTIAKYGGCYELPHPKQKMTGEWAEMCFSSDKLVGVSIHEIIEQIRGCRDNDYKPEESREWLLPLSNEGKKTMIDGERLTFIEHSELAARRYWNLGGEQ